MLNEISSLIRHHTQHSTQQHQWQLWEHPSQDLCLFPPNGPRPRLGQARSNPNKRTHARLTVYDPVSPGTLSPFHCSRSLILFPLSNWVGFLPSCTSTKGDLVTCWGVGWDRSQKSQRSSLYHGHRRRDTRTPFSKVVVVVGDETAETVVRMAMATIGGTVGQRAEASRARPFFVRIETRIEVGSLSSRTHIGKGTASLDWPILPTLKLLLSLFPTPLSHSLGKAAPLARSFAKKSQVGGTEVS